MNELFLTFGLVCVALVALIWRQTMALESMSGAKARSEDRTRRDCYQLIERLLEKRDTNDALELARVHRVERVQQVRQDAETERAATAQPEPTKPEESEFVSPENYEP